MNWNPHHSNRWILAGTLCGIVIGLLGHTAGWSRFASILWAGTTVLALLPLTISVARSLLRGEIGVDIIALLAMVGALLLSQYLAGAVIALMLSGGNSLEEFADVRARRELSALISRAPRLVHRYRGETLESPEIGEVRQGDFLLVKPGEIIPVDGVVVGSTAIVDESALTGEALPVEHRAGEQVRSGTINAAQSPFRMRASSTAENSTYSAIIRLVQKAQASKAPLLRLADRYAMLFLPLTLVVAALAWGISGDPVRALAVLVVATPCPLILAAPVAILSGISQAARRGIVVKGGGALELLARAKILVLDKTGTVTVGAPVLSSIESFGVSDPDQILGLAASLDQVSPHVLAGPILKAASDRKLTLSFPEEVTEELGSGIRGRVNGVEVALGKCEWVQPGSSALPAVHRLSNRTLMEGSSSVFVAINGELAGALVLEDLIRPDAAVTLRALRRVGFEKIVMLTGDHEDVAKVVGAALGVDKVFAERSPEEKVEAVKAAREGGVNVMVGDGINDAAALAAADVGIAMGARGASASSEAADMVLMVDRLDRVTEAGRLARRSRSIALQSISAGMGLSFFAMGFAAAGTISPVTGAFLQEFIDVLVILNALRSLRPVSSNHTLDGTITALGEKFRQEHRVLVPQVRRIRRLADRLESLPPSQAILELRESHKFLVEQLLPHDQAEDAIVYPAVAKLIGGDDPTAPMNRAHLEIAHLVNVLGRVLDDLPEEGPSAEDLPELRRVLYGLDAVLKLHFAQEEESYLALLDVEHAKQNSPLPKRRSAR
jgi:heavy metal translocating P-type ATPase